MSDKEKDNSLPAGQAGKPPKISYAFTIVMRDFGPCEIIDAIVEGKRYEVKKPGSLFEVYRALAELQMTLAGRFAAGETMMAIEGISQKKMAQMQMERKMQEEAAIKAAIARGELPPVLKK